ncbi:Uncharacterized protein, contains FMN-binding domain [Micromonospora rhizosphaerae]|uniref:Uncharacterized protein, contains FMN-binding domain n=1 Tax=Micromonospora rhizosphaerae TaxID=568872 RepID=A0A1C6T928_9ACTN|nr:FMN-binding protein [Micromonospora rhizosphaerae]SCL38033.1 Uncharacterized protein, contains FMN-binding domain [Micromonospora rhizosphaerae]
MRRAVLAITGLAAGTTALVVLKGAPGTSQVAQDLPADQASVVPGSSAAPGATPDPAASAGYPYPGASPSRTPNARTSTGARATTAPPQATTAAPKTTIRKVTGPVVSNKYGDVQVQITLSGTRIVNAVALELPRETAQSSLRSDKVDAAYSGTSGQVVRRQNANLDTVSGATYTSNSYKQSLQAAIDRA